MLGMSDGMEYHVNARGLKLYGHMPPCVLDQT
jgi:hypothetical protein